MRRSLALAALAVLCASGSPSHAQTQDNGCDGPVTAKAGRGGPCSELGRKIAEVLAEPAVSRAHWGIDVTALDGAPIYSLNEAQFFQPASNTKLFTTAAAMALLGENATFETKVISLGTFSAPGRLSGNVVILGGNDANLSGREIPYVSPSQRPKLLPGQQPPPGPPPLRYLEEMADQVAKTGLKVVNGDVIGDDTLYPWEPYASDWSIDDTVWGYGAPVSALTINDNQLKVTVTPGSQVSNPAAVMVDPAVPYYTIDTVGLVTSAAKTGSHVQMARELGSKTLRIYGTIALDAQPDEEEVAIHDPAEYAAIAFKSMLEARGIVVTGVAKARHNLPLGTAGFQEQARAPLSPQDLDSGCGVAADGPQIETSVLATHTSVPLGQDVVVTNKVSQNLHAELLLRALGIRSNISMCSPSFVGGAQVVRSFLTTKVGIDPDDFVFYDGSGLSGHDLVTPRATARLLQYATAQRWFADWRSSLPVGGEDGSLNFRFGKPPLRDRVFAKTGTLGEARALSGYIECASGRTVIFSIMVSAHAPGSSADRVAMDKIVGLIAAAN
jgi:serine-type D-Ala-D-Ala carboxypeptidase/endopeptidase (penicillin-binding protein 4)